MNDRLWRMDQLGFPAGRARADRADPSTWLGDEVAIDFPSIDALVTRMRDALWAGAEDDHVVQAEVELSARQARTGASVPLDLGLRATCARCGGRGESWTESCGACDGRGESLVRHTVTVTVPARVVDGTSFCFVITAARALPTRVELRVAIR
jgi:hypothetical protein